MLQNKFFLRQFRLTKWSFFVHSTTRNAPYVHPRLDSILVLCRTFSIDCNPFITKLIITQIWNDLFWLFLGLVILVPIQQNQPTVQYSLLQYTSINTDLDIIRSSCGSQLRVYIEDLTWVLICYWIYLMSWGRDKMWGSMNSIIQDYESLFIIRH